MARHRPNPPPFGGARFLTATDVMRLLSYTDRSAFWQAVRRNGLPYVRLNARRCVFEESAVREWLDAHTVGSVPRP
jgi:predicted DNA-binding transcriptional regulator AlpA